MIELVNKYARSSNYSIPSAFDWGDFSDHAIMHVDAEISKWRVYRWFKDVQEGDVCVDLGSSAGPWTHSILDQKPKRVVCVEPNPELARAIHKNCLDKAKENGVQLDIVEAAIISEDQVTGMLKHIPWFKPMKFSQFIKENNLPKIDFLKMDIEGGEYEVFSDENIDYLVNNVKFITMELHVRTPASSKDKIQNRKNFIAFRDKHLHKFGTYKVFGDGFAGTGFIDYTDKMYDDNFIMNFDRELMMYIDNESIFIPPTIKTTDKKMTNTIEYSKRQTIDLYNVNDKRYGGWGWCSLDKAGCIIDAIDEICRKQENPVCVEVGVYGGKSTFPAALELKRHGKGIIHAIDPWSNEEATKEYDGDNADWWSRADLNWIYNVFKQTIKDTNTDDQINVIRQPSDDAPDFEYIDYLYIDGQHTTQAFRDADKYATKIRPGGYCFIDDINWGVLGTDNLPKYIENLGFEFVKTVDMAAIYRKKREDADWVPEFSSPAETQSSCWIVDNFYKDPDAVREFALKQDYHIGGVGRGYIGNRTHRQFLFPGLKERFESIMGRKITNWQEHSMNGRFQWCVSGQPQVWHCDSQQWGGMLYLTPNAPYAYGTTMYANKKTRARTYREPGWDASWYVQGGDPHQDGQDFEPVDVFGNVYNRLVIFDAAAIHSSSGYFGVKKEDCRLWQMFFFDTES